MSGLEVAVVSVGLLGLIALAVLGAWFLDWFDR